MTDTSRLTIEEPEKKHGQPWMCNHGDDGLIKELLGAGITVGLAYTVTIVEPENTSEYSLKEESNADKS